METMLLTVTLLSLLAAVAAGVLSWRVVRQDRLRSEARVAALAAEIDSDDASDARHYVAGEANLSVVEPGGTDEFPIREQEEAIHGGLFSEPRSERTGGRLAAVAAAGALVVAMVGGALVLSSGDGAPRPPVLEQSADAGTPSVAVPLELIALGHERESDRLTVRGVVRGPASNSASALTAVVLLYDRGGEFIASGRAEVGDADAAPGDDRRFVVSVPGGAQVSRYRVSFRSADHIVPHVDRRNPVI